MKHILYFFDARKGSRIDVLWARSDIYVVNFDLFVFIEGVIFQNVHSNIKVAVWYGDSRFQRFLMISSHLHRNFQFWNLFYLVTKTSTQLLFKNAGGCWDETYINWKAWLSSFRKNCRKLWEAVRKVVATFLKNGNFQSHQRWQHIIQGHTYEFSFHVFGYESTKNVKKSFLID